MARGTRTVYPGNQNKGLSLTFKPPEDGRSVQCCDKHGNKDEDNNPQNIKNVNKNLQFNLFCRPKIKESVKRYK